MASLLEGLTQQLSGAALQQVSRQLGTNDANAGSAISAALPMILGALAKNASRPEGAEALNRALQKDHDGSVLNDVQGAVSGYEQGSGAAILKHVFGGKQDAVATGVGQAAGLDTSKAGALLAMLAPVVMGALGKAQRSGSLDAGGLAAMLGQERQHLETKSAGLGSLLSMLDADKDGSIVDDVLGMAAKFLGKR